MSTRGSGFASIYVWNAADSKLSRLTDDMFNAGSPVWDPQGNYLYFASQREFAPQISNIEFNYATNRDVYLYAMALRKDVKHPFPAESDEVAVTKPKDEGAPAEKKEGEGEKPAEAKPATPPAPKAMTIDFDGISGRVARVPIGADNYGGISAKPGFLIYATGPAFYYGRQGDRPAQLKMFSLKDRRETVLIDDFGGGYALSRDGSKILARQGPGFGLYDATPQGDKSRKPVSTAGLVVDRVPAEEWNQIFNEVWRRYRDWFYVPNMHGYDWVALREQYKPLLQYVAHRSDLNYVISEMISELTIQHAYIEGGDFQIPPRPRVGLMGARLEVDKASGRYRMSKIFEGENEEDIYRSPLKEIGVNVNVGDYVLAIDCDELIAKDAPDRMLRNKADNPVSLTVNNKPSMDG